MTRRIALIAGGAAVVLLIAWFLLLWSPKGGELTEAHERRDVAQQKVTELQVRLDRLKDAQRREPQLLATRDRLASAIPEKPDLAAFILDANDAAAKAGVDFISIAPTPPAVSTVLGVPAGIRLNISVSGPYFATLNFLDRLADLPRIMVVDSVQVSPSGAGESSSTEKLSVALTGEMFTTQPPVSATPTTTTVPGAPTTTTTTAAQ